jgi:hypothetical protein
MGVKMTITHKRLSPDESVALLKDKDTKKLVWRHRFKNFKKAGAIGTQDFKDYKHKKFKNTQAFYDFIDTKNELAKIKKKDA